MRLSRSALRGRNIIERFAAAWLPPRCLICGGSGATGIDLCDACLGMLPSLSAPVDGRLACQRCGDLCVMAGACIDGSEPVCARCTASRPLFGQLVAPLRYDYPVDRLIRALKHDGDRRVARVLGELLAREALRRREPAAKLPDCLLPVPLHPARMTRRGFNHAADLARWAGRRAGLPVCAGQAIRVVDTGSLAELSRAERQLRIRGAFRVDERLAGRHVALVDDVATSGATTSELARECHDSGVASVSVWVVARTVASVASPVTGAASSRRSASGKR